jgi:phosphate:Na+ symporter
MTSDLDYWKFLAGVGLFLYGMERLEGAIKSLAGKKFKLFLKKYTKNRFFAILNGIVATAILQSSSIVLLMVIAFAGVGILSLSNSLGIILGANLGTTMTGWLVSAIGFGTKIENFTFPMIAIGSLGMILIQRRFYLYQIFAFLVAVGLLFMGLEFMKTSMSHLSEAIDVRELAKFGSWAFFLLGFVVTAIIQSSSAMMTITLSALYSNLITLEPAAYIAIGADLGTTMTGLLASFNGTAVKKRVGIAHFFFNIGTAILALLTVKPILSIFHNQFSNLNNLVALVSFHSIFNLLGVIIFFPFLGIFERFLNSFFVTNNHACTFVHKVSTEIPEASLAAIKLELHLLLNKVFHFNMNIFAINNESLQDKKIQDKLPEYSHIKLIEDEMLIYLAKLQREKLEDLESDELSQYISALRNAVQSAKSSKDIEHNFQEFTQSIVLEEEEFIHKIHELYAPTFEITYSLIKDAKQNFISQRLISAFSENNNAYHSISDWIYQKTMAQKETSFKSATFLNVNRDVYTANKNFLEAIKSIQAPSPIH